MKIYLNRYDHIQSFINQYSANIVVSEEDYDDTMIISINPKHHNQPQITLYIHKKTHYIDLQAGIGFHVDDLYWNDFPIDKVLNSIADGYLIEYIRIYNNKEVGISGYLAVDGEDMPIYSNRTFSLIGELLYLFRKNKKSVRYAPFS